MDTGTLVAEQLATGNRFLSELEKSIRVVVAYWLKEEEEGEWHLFVASDRFNGGKIGKAYEEVMRIAEEMQSRSFSGFQVKLVGLNEPIAQAVLKYYANHPPRIPRYFHQLEVCGVYVEEACLLKGPTGEYEMPSGREVLNQIIDREAEFFQRNGQAPRKIKLPVLMAYDLAKCGRDDLGELSGRVFKEGITAFEKEGFHGMAVQIVRDRNAILEFE